MVNVLAAIWLALCALAAIVSPARFSWLALFSLTTPFAVAANVFFMFLWLFSSRKFRSVLSLSALLVSYKVVITILGFNYFGENDMVRRPSTIKIISWNAHGLGIFNRPQNKEFNKRILEYLKEENADILCIPEFSVTKSNIMKPNAEKIIDNGHYIDYRFNPDNSLNNKVYLGTAVFSKYPFRNYESHQLAELIYMMQGDIELPAGKIIRVFFVHLTTFGLSDKDKEYIDDAKQNRTMFEDDLQVSKSFVEKFRNAYAKRAVEAEKAARIIEASPYPVVICGDLNDLPGSYTYTRLRGKLNDAFLDKGRGLGRTYNRISPTLRIDHFFYDAKALKLVGFDCPTTALSDHNPIITNFEINPKPRN
ncbi:endonuclease/exonuclease/phosphatase family protein [Polluticoccus soli]|uniref:endonuclease/exonuclease/phosphatase family protein n=1 Tax=Polluticoccus soli TaxID=3034150 RepID=UPI0023E19575|nr:endonuclease/exonuclease/phosphatase family protein [Flavipsychrobacter sp. JY13-12]